MKRSFKNHKDVAEKYVSQLSFDEKISILYGTPDEKAKLGFYYIDFSGEAAHGVQARHDQTFDLGDPVCTTVFPNPIGMAATFDKKLMRDIGEVVGTEMRSLLNEGRHNCIIGLAPTVDMERDPRWGRNEEAYGEDPRLASRMAGEYVLGMAGDDPEYVLCGSTLKHFYANNYENERYFGDSVIPQELKEDYYLRVFKEIIEYSQPLSVMTAYNRVNDVVCAFNPENHELLRAWGVPFLVSDGFAIQHAVEDHHSATDPIDAIRKAMDGDIDMFFEKPEFERPAMKEAIEKGIVTEQDIDKRLINKLTVYSVLGLMPDELGEDKCSKAFPKSEYNMSRVETDKAKELARVSVERSAVLLKNDGMLPLKEEDIEEKGLYMFGPFMDYAPMDWYSGLPSYKKTFKDGLGISGSDLIPRVKLLIDGKYAGLDNERIVPVEKYDAEIFSIMLWDDSRISLKAESNGRYVSTRPSDVKMINFEGVAGKYELYASAKEIFSWYVNESFQLTDENGEVIHFGDDSLRFWEDDRIRGLMNHDGSRGIGFETVSSVEDQIKEAAVDNDLNSDSLILACFGIHPIVNSKEERDRDTIELPAFQRLELRKLRERFNNIALILLANEPVAILEEAEADEIRSILWIASGCQELGTGFARIISGEVSPSGRLPQTWYKGDHQLGPIDDYDIRKNRMTYLYMTDKPLYRFGYGLTYSDFECEIIDKASMKVRVKNTGAYASDYVIQIYESPDGVYYLYGDDRDGLDTDGNVIPVGSRLVAFERVYNIHPGEETEVSVVF